jgi:general stress protein YciG
MSAESAEDRGKPLRGFAAMTVEQRARISSLGGKAAHEAGTAHEFTPAEAREAGRKGGNASASAKKREK